VNKGRKALNGLAVGTAKMKVVVGQFGLIVALHTYGKVLLAVIGHNFVHNAIFAKAIEYSVNGGPVGVHIHFPFDGVLAHCFSCIGQYRQHCLFGCCVSSSHSNATNLQLNIATLLQ
tara:strand:+ start:1332 stop:1682 length:351 start_codon:yes stop_codon:yes gene_type:complete